MSSTDLPEESASRSADESPSSRSTARKGGGGGPVQFVRDTRLEMKRVTWPTRSEVVSTTVVVMVAVVFFSVYLWGVDSILNLVFETFEKWVR